MNVSAINPSSSNTTITTQQSQSGGTLAADQGKHSGKNALVDSPSSPSIQDKRQAALDIVNKTLAAAYEKISSRGQSSATSYETFEPLTAEKVAGNILGFIERRLQLDAAEGATPEQLQTRLEAGLAGFKKGFAEASEKLEALSLLSPEIKSDIGKTYDLVLSGVDELRKKYVDILAPQPGSANSSKPSLDTTAISKSPATLKVPEFIPAAKSAPLGYGNYEYGRAREFSFQLTTKEGDKVTIKASSSEGFAIEAGRSNSATVMKGSYSASQTFSLQIEGDLNEEELTAINELLGRVNELAGQFFAGNLDDAFKQAVNLGYDEQQIGSFALNLAQAEIQQVTRAYQVVGPLNTDVNHPQLMSAQLLPMGEFIRDLLDSLGRASIFDELSLLVANIAEKTVGADATGAEQGKRFRTFIEQIVAMNLR